MNNNKFELTLCELFHPKIHGMDDDSDPHILKHFIVITSYSNIHLELTDSEEGDSTDEDTYCENEESTLIRLLNIITMDIGYYNRNNNRNHRNIPKTHPIIRNYLHIRKRRLHIDITENIILSGGEKVCIIKTIWIRIIQRKWKRVYREYRSYLWGRYLRVLRGGARLEPRVLLRGLLCDLPRR